MAKHGQQNDGKVLINERGTKMMRNIEAYKLSKKQEFTQLDILPLGFVTVFSFRVKLPQIMMIKTGI